MRAAIAEGMTVITQAGNKEWVENMARRPHTIQPDMLAKNVVAPQRRDRRRRARIQGSVDDRDAVSRRRQSALRHDADGLHPARSRCSIEVDAFSPGSAVQPYAANLLENIQKRNLRVDKIVPLHGAIAPFAELVKVAGAK